MKSHPPFNLRRGLLASAILAASLPTAQAFEIDTGNQDWSVRFDNTVRFNYGQRVESANSKLANSFNNNDGNRNFSAGSAVTQRIDLLTELDVVYQNRMGFRVSTNTWYDHAYNNIGSSNAAPNRIKNGQPTSSGLSGYGERYNNGLSAEVLDAFLFFNTEIGDESQMSVKLGQTTTYWGETIINAAHGIAYGQAGLDLGKQLALPGTEAKELFLPRQQLNVNFNLNEELSFGAQYFLGWDAARLTEGGSYLGFNDFMLNGGHEMSFIAAPNPYAGATGFLGLTQINNPLSPLNGLYVGPDFGDTPAPDFARAYKGKTHTPDDLGDFGLTAKWSPEWLDGTLGFYYRNTSDILPNLVLKPSADLAPGSAPITACLDQAGVTCVGVVGTAGALGAPLPAAILSGNAGVYDILYADDIDIFGISLSKNIGGISVASDLSYRENMPLASVAATVNPLMAGQPGMIAGFNGDSDDAVAKGKTLHFVVSGVVSFGDTPLWDSSSLLGELAYSRWLSVDKNEHLFKGESWYRGVDKVTKDNFVLGVNFTPVWFQVLPGLDMSLPMSVSYGLDGHSAVALGGNKGAGNYAVGVGADLYNKYRFDLKYVDHFGDFDTCETGTDGAAPGAAGNYACVIGQPTSSAGAASPLLKDRGMVTFTFKTTF